MRPSIKRGRPRGRASLSPVDELFFELPIPPSANALYQRRRGGGLALSKRAKEFKEQVKGIVGDHLSAIMRFPVDGELIYTLRIVLYFDKLENPGWFKHWEKDVYFKRGAHKGELKGRAGERKAQSRYKAIDYDNRIKFLQDCIVSAIGVPNDAQIFKGTSEKHEDPNNPRAEVWIKTASRDDFFGKER